MKKKIILTTASLLAVLSITACSSNNQEIATMKGGKITVDDFYNSIKKQPETQETVSRMIIEKVFLDKYGKDVTKEDIQKAFDETKKNYTDSGQDFNQALKQNNLSEKTYKDRLKTDLAYRAGVKKHIKITDEDLKAVWGEFHPEVEAQIIQVASEEDAKKIKQEITDGADFGKLAKEKSEDASKEDNGNVKFDSQTETIPANVKQDAFKLKDGEVSEPIQAYSSMGQASYYIVKMVKNKDKGNDLTPYKKELTEIAEAAKINDQAFTAEVMSKELKDANVKIKDDAFKGALAGLIDTDDKNKNSSDSKDKEKNSDSKKDDKDKADDSSDKKDDASASEESSK